MNILILSASASAINCLQSLQGKEGLKLFVTDSSKYGSGLYYRDVTSFIIARARNIESYRQDLDRIIEANNIDILIPSSDHDMQGVAELRKQGWKPNVKMFDFPIDNFLLYVDKEKLINKLFDMKGPVPENYNRNNIPQYPVVVKPLREGGSKGVSIVANHSELNEAIKQLEENYGNEWVVQEFIPGDTGSIFVVLLLFGQNGKLYAESVSYSTRTFMSWGGGGTAGRLSEEYEVLEVAKSMLDSLGGWKGPINLEFKKNNITGKFYLMEINCRLNGYSYLTTMNNINFPMKMIELLKNEGMELNVLPLNFKENDKKIPFVLGYRERVLTNWIENEK